VQTLRDNVVYLALGLAVVDLVLAILFFVLLARVGKLRRAQQTVLGVHGERDIVAHAEQLAEQVRNMRVAVEKLDERLDRHKSELDHAFTLRAVERYDAFNDIGGQQSASIALLDRHRSGVVVSSIHSRDYARLYVKELRDGVPDRDLSPEEEVVVRMAQREATPATPASPAVPPQSSAPVAPAPSQVPVAPPSPPPIATHSPPPTAPAPPATDAPVADDPGRPGTPPPD